MVTAAPVNKPSASKKIVSAMAGIRRRTTRGKKGKRKKKGGKHEAKVDKQLEAERVKANVSLWESRLKVTELSRAEYQDVARSLARSNEQLTKNQYQLETDMLDVIGFLKKQDMEKDELIETLQQQLIAEKEQAEEDKERLTEIYRKQISDLEEKCSQNVTEMQIIQSEFKMMKEFRRRKAELERELEEIKDSLHRANKDHKESLGSMERRFLQEKETSEQLVQDKILQVAEKNADIHELQQTVRTLERALARAILEKESTVQQTQLRVQIADQAEMVELQKLQEVLKMKDQELNRIKKLSHNILQERREVEHFFLEALEQVKQEIKSSRNYYQKMAQTAYHSRMIQAAAGMEQYPKIRTFHNKDHSTNDVSKDLQAAEKWSHVQTGPVDIGDMTWEQKEKVLRLLFAKMNGSVTRKRIPGSRNVMVPAGKTERGHHPRKPGEMTESTGTVFITEHVPDKSATTLVLPDIHMVKFQVMD
ncbi:basal body-orientation factor 1 isoform X3 [Mixophyes fleayi]|uniref:basal body-orientation factor 1 isoform X3 n=1 Tax=Mixophyes fleayi TaxID=3061075 RepID=UPI003F4D9501